MNTHAAFAPAGGIQELSFDEIAHVGGGKTPVGPPKPAAGATGDAILSGTTCVAGIGAMYFTAGAAFWFVGAGTLATCLKAAEDIRRAAGCKPYSSGAILACGKST
jgi:hypothetical protein